MDSPEMYHSMADNTYEDVVIYKRLLQDLAKVAGDDNKSLDPMQNGLAMAIFNLEREIRRIQRVLKIPDHADYDAKVDKDGYDLKSGLQPGHYSKRVYHESNWPTS